MKYAVCIKQVPEASDLKMEDGRLVRSGAEGVINAVDKNAIEEALRLRDAHGGEITVVSMGPSQTESALREALNTGADRAVLISDPAIAGSDTIATSRVLAAALDTLADGEPFDVILTGKQASDGDTGQVGPGIAERLDIPQITYVSTIVADDGSVTAVRDNRQGTETVKAAMPVLLTVTEKAANLRHASIKTKMAAKKKKIETLTLEDIGISPEQAGDAGSQTIIEDVFLPEALPKGVIIDEGEGNAQAVFEKLEEFGIL